MTNEFPIAGDFYKLVLVFSDVLYDSSKFIAEVVSHEAGHSFGLLHDGTSTNPYYDGQGIWAPIMGTGYSKTLTQWSKGEYFGANNKENDIALIEAMVSFQEDFESFNVYLHNHTHATMLVCIEERG